MYKLFSHSVVFDSFSPHGLQHTRLPCPLSPGVFWMLSFLKWTGIVFWMLSFKSAFSLSSFTFIKRLFSSSSLSATRVVSSACLRLLLFLRPVLIPAWASSSPAFRMVYSAHKLNKQGDNIQPCSTPFPILNKSVVPHPVWTVASQPAYRFLRIFHILLWST